MVDEVGPARCSQRRGFFGASLDEVSEEAGFSKGAVYSNFDDKEDLLLALVEDRVAQRTRRVTQLVDADAPEQSQTREAAEEYGHILDEEREWAPLFMEFWACVARNPEMQRRFASRYRTMKAATVRLIEERALREGVELPMPAEQIATALFAMGNGFSLERLADPDGVSDELFGAMLTNFFAGLEAPAVGLYAATKAGLRALALCIREDLCTVGVGVSVIAPGPISDAGIWADAGLPYRAACAPNAQKPTPTRSWTPSSTIAPRSTSRAAR